MKQIEFVAENDEGFVLRFMEDVKSKNKELDVGIYDEGLGPPDLFGLSLPDVKRLIAFLENFVAEED